MLTSTKNKLILRRTDSKCFKGYKYMRSQVSFTFRISSQNKAKTFICLASKL